MMKMIKPMMLGSLLALSALLGSAVHAQVPYVNATIQGALAPGVYGRIDLGNAPPPPLIYAQPIIIQRPSVFVQQQPLYLHVPPGHAKKWSKHCARYNACGHPVYFVRVQGDDDYERRGYERRSDERRGYERDDDEGKHHGKRNGGHKKDKHDD